MKNKTNFILILIIIQHCIECIVNRKDEENKIYQNVRFERQNGFVLQLTLISFTILNVTRFSD